MNKRIYGPVVALLLCSVAFAADDLTYDAIKTRHPAVSLTDAQLSVARGEGECLAGIKELNSLPMEGFQPNIEWLNFRTNSLLQHMRPCEVLVLLEAAHDALDTANAPSRRE